MNGSTVDVPTPDGVADCYLTSPDDGEHPGVLLMIDAIGLRPRIEEMADRIAAQGYVVLAPTCSTGLDAHPCGIRPTSAIPNRGPLSCRRSARSSAR